MSEIHKLTILCLLLLNVRHSISTSTLISLPNKTNVAGLIQKLVDIREKIDDLISPYLKITISDLPPNCVQMECLVICFNGKSEDVERDIKRTMASSPFKCEALDELRLFNYNFPNNVIPLNFLGNYTNKITRLYIANSNVTDFEDGAFGYGIFESIVLENLKLLCLRRGFFKNINLKYIESFEIIQKQTPLVSICEGTFADVRYRIKSITLKVGIPCIRNITASNVLLNNLANVDFSYNSLGTGLRSDTFDMLSRVRKLDLSHSKIHFIPEYIFQKLDCLEELDISHNLLTTITANIFGWNEFPKYLRIEANSNDWHCTCDLQRQMQIIFLKHENTISCQAPLEFSGWWVFDDRLCDDDNKISSMPTTTSIQTTPYSGTITSIYPSDGNWLSTTVSHTVEPYYSSTTTKSPLMSIINLECKRPPSFDRFDLKIKPAVMDFTLSTVPNFSVNVVVSPFESFDERYGLIWFSKVTKEYYKMEVNYNEYGFGCFGTISLRTIVDNLLPDVSYTFCLVNRFQLTVSPFNCKSMHMPGNLGVRYHAWLTRDLRATGISLFVLGVIMFTFIGIAAIFIVLKNKPILLKGSKRIATSKGSNNEIIVLPKDRTFEELRQKEEILSKRNSKSIINTMQERRKSTDSADSNTSYMNANLYEELPAYFKVDPNISPCKQLNSLVDETDKNLNYITPLKYDENKFDLISYAEIPFRQTITSNDPLPEAPKKNKKDKSIKNQQNLTVFDNDNDLTPVYFAFTHDCSV